MLTISTTDAWSQLTSRTNSKPESSVAKESLQRCDIKTVSLLNLLAAVYDGDGHGLKGGRPALKQSAVSDTILFLMRRCVADEVLSWFWDWDSFLITFVECFDG